MILLLNINNSIYQVLPCNRNNVYAPIWFFKKTNDNSPKLMNEQFYLIR